MGRRRKRLIVQADLTSEEDQAFLAWVLERRRKRRLAEEIRQGLQLQYRRLTDPTGRHEPAPELPTLDRGVLPGPEPPAFDQVVLRQPEPAARESGSAASKLARLVGGF